MRSYTLSINSFLSDPRTARTAVFLILALIVAYVFLVNRTVLTVVERKMAESSSAELSTQISELEFKYIALNSRLDLALASELGFHEIPTPVFASRPGRALTLR